MQQIVRGGIFRLSFTVFNFLVGLFIAAIAGTELFGTLSLMIINAAVFQIITGLGTDAAIIWHGSSKSISKEKAFSFTFYTALLQLGFFLMAAILFLKFTDKLFLSRQANNSFYWAELMYFIGIVITEKYSSLFYSQQKQHVCNKVLSIISFAFLLIFGIVYFFDWIKNFNPLWFFCWMIFFQSLALLFTYHLKESFSLKKLNKEEIQSFAHFSFLVFVTNTIQFLAYRSDYWFINYFKQLTDVGVYAQAVRFAQLLWVLPNIAAALILPVLAAPEGLLSENKLLKIIKIANWINIVLIGFLLIFAFLAYAYFIPDFASGFRALIIMLPGYYFFCISILFAAYFSAKRKLIYNFYGSLICFGLIIVFDILLIPRWSIEGAAISNTMAYTLATIFNIFMFQRSTGISMKKLFFFEKVDWTDFKQLITRIEKTS